MKRQPKYARKALWLNLPSVQAKSRRTRKPLRTNNQARAKLMREYRRLRTAWIETFRGARCMVAQAVNIGYREISEVHHIRGRSGKLLIATRYWLPVSREGHQWIHDNRREAIARGWLAGPGEWGRP